MPPPTTTTSLTRAILPRRRRRCDGLTSMVPMEELTQAELAARAGIAVDEVDRLVRLGVLVLRDGPKPLRSTDVLKVRVAAACESGGLPMDGIAQAIAAGKLSFSFLEAWPFQQFNVPTDRTHAQVANELGIPFDIVQRVSEAFGFVRPGP